MVAILEVTLVTLCVAVLIPVAVLVVEVMLAVGAKPRSMPSSGVRRRLAVLIPAHDESSMITATLRAITPQLKSGDRVLVVADNCTDDTAAIAARAGAEVIERADREQRGKGYALDFGIRHLERDPPDLVIVIDADCHVTPGAIECLARTCDASSRPVQALYLMRSPGNAGVTRKLAEFAWLIKNQVRPAGLSRWNLPCHLTGSGMAFLWPHIRRANLATGHIVEDLKLGIDFAMAGLPVRYCPDALVTSEFANSEDGARTQHTRWTHGHLMIIGSECPRLAAATVATGNLKLLLLMLDVAIPPLTLLSVLVLATWLAGLAFYVKSGAMLPLDIATVAGIALTAALYLSWRHYGKHLLSAADLSLAVFYALRKAPLYGKFIVARQTAWIRSKRDHET